MGLCQQLLQAVCTGEDIIIHAPYPVSPLPVGIVNACVEASRASHVLLVNYTEISLLVKPLGCTISTSVVYHHNTSNGRIPPQATDVALEQLQAIEGHYYSKQFHLSHYFLKV